MLLRNELKELRAESHDINNKSCKLRTESQMLRNKSAKNEIGIIIDTSRRPRKESESIRQESAQIIDTSQGLRKELKVIREESLQINDRSQKPRISDNDNKPCDNEPCDNDNDKSMLQVTINVIDENKDIIKEHTTKNKSIKSEK